jgi:hypothetical protein
VSENHILKTTSRFPESIMLPRVGQSEAFMGRLGGTYARAARPDCWNRGSQISLRETLSGLVKRNVKTSLGLESMKDLTVCK